MNRKFPAAIVTVLLIAVSGSAASAPRSRAATAPVIQRHVSLENNSGCDITVSPAATLLLPFFEVDITKPVNDAANTLFTVINTVQKPQIARVTIWTDYGHPALWFNVFLTGFDVQAISLYDVVGQGILPNTSNGQAIGNRSAPNNSNAKLVGFESCGTNGGNLTPSVLRAVQTMLTSGTQEAGDCQVGSPHSNATGYITVDVVNSCTATSPLDPVYYSQILLYDNVLTGDYEHVYPDKTLGNFAGGSPMVHVKAIPDGGSASVSTPLPYTFYDRFTPSGARRIDRRQPLPSAFAARYIQGGTAEFFTEFAMWREGTTVAARGCASANAAIPVTSIVRFDDAENPTTVAPAISQTMPLASSITTGSPMFPPLAGQSLTGWMYLNLDNRASVTSSVNPYSSSRASQNWVVVRMRAEGRYGIDYDATALGNGCVQPVVASVIPPEAKVSK
ncbi:MAG: hypothetical protein JWN02_1772 [Acidobacteria bacterium]|nr:hypothetical protein [Acidobacteriota bacterium]